MKQFSKTILNWIVVSFKNIFQFISSIIGLGLMVAMMYLEVGGIYYAFQHHYFPSKIAAIMFPPYTWYIAIDHLNDSLSISTRQQDYLKYTGNHECVNVPKDKYIDCLKQHSDKHITEEQEDAYENNLHCEGFTGHELGNCLSWNDDDYSEDIF